MPTPAVPTAPSCPPLPCPADGTAPPQGPQDMTIDFVSHAARNAFRSERASISMRMAQRMKKEPVYLDAVKSARFILAYLPDGRLLLVKGNTRIAALERFGEVRRSPGDPLPCVVLEFDTELLAAKHCGNIQLVGQAFQRSNSYLDAHEVGLRVLELAVANAEKAHRVYDYDATKQKGLGTEFVEKTKISNAFGQNTMSHRAILEGDQVAEDALHQIYADARVEEDTLVRNEEDWAAETRVYRRRNVEHFLKLRAADEIDGALELFRSRHGGDLTLNELKKAFPIKKLVAALPATQPQTRPKRTAGPPSCIGQDGGCRRAKRRKSAAAAEEQEVSAADGSGAAHGSLFVEDGTLINTISPSSPTRLHIGPLGAGAAPPVTEVAGAAGEGQLPATGTGATRTDTVELTGGAGDPPADAAPLQAPPAGAGGDPPADAAPLQAPPAGAAGLQALIQSLILGNASPAEKWECIRGAFVGTACAAPSHVGEGAGPAQHNGGSPPRPPRPGQRVPDTPDQRASMRPSGRFRDATGPAGTVEKDEEIAALLAKIRILEAENAALKQQQGSCLKDRALR